MVEVQEEQQHHMAVTEFKARCCCHIDTALSNTAAAAAVAADAAVTADVVYPNERTDLIFQAYRGLPLNQYALQRMIGCLDKRETADFELVKLIRIMEYTTTTTTMNQINNNNKNNTADAESILSILLRTITMKQIPLWLEKNEKIRCYWSENHMILWTSSAFLLQEKLLEMVEMEQEQSAIAPQQIALTTTGRVGDKGIKPEMIQSSLSSSMFDSHLRTRLLTYLDTKIQYGFYEYFSNAYFSATLNGLLNLVDFVKYDVEIKQKAIVVTKRLLNELVCYGTNQHGTYLVAQGRTSIEQLRTGYAPAISLLTGWGQQPIHSSFETAFLATTSMDFMDVLLSWKPNIYTTIMMGHPLQETKTIYQHLSREERIIFQWSYGGYFHPMIVHDTMWLIHQYQLQYHSTFKFISYIPRCLHWMIPLGVNLFKPISCSSVLTGTRVTIYRHGPSILSSSSLVSSGNENGGGGGWIGWQQCPIVATTGTIPVFLLSGGGQSSKQKSLGSQNQNSHVPTVIQKQHVALIVYHQSYVLQLLTKLNIIDLEPSVQLQWCPEKYTEIIITKDNNWIVARENDYGYIGIRCCGGSDNCGFRCSNAFVGCGGDDNNNNNNNNNNNSNTNGNTTSTIKSSSSLLGSCCCSDATQSWVMIVGNNETHGTFEQFQKVIQESKFQQKKHHSKHNKNNILLRKNIYSTTIEVDGIIITHNWT